MTTVRNWVRDGLRAAVLGDVATLRRLLALQDDRYHRVAELLSERVPSRGGGGEPPYFTFVVLHWLNTSRNFIPAPMCRFFLRDLFLDTCLGMQMIYVDTTAW